MPKPRAWRPDSDETRPDHVRGSRGRGKEGCRWGHSMTLRFITTLITCLVAESTPVSAQDSAAQGREVEVVGPEKFKAQVGQALRLLEQKAPGAYALVLRYVGRIKHSQRSGMWAFKEPPTYEMSARTAFYSVTWCAGTIAHDALHSKLYHDHRKQHAGRVPADVWTGEVAEKRCILFQLEVLEQIGAPDHETAYCRKLKGTHHDVNKDGKYDKEDYRERDW